MVRRYRNGWWLEIKYHVEGLTQGEIAELCDVSPRTIRKYMKEFEIETRDVKGENHGLYGTERDAETRAKIAESLMGREISEEWKQNISEGLEGRQPPDAVREKISQSLSGTTRDETTRLKMSESTAGRDNPNWKGGYSRRYGPGWSVARQRVIDRDGVCQHCGHDGSDRRLEVHHIIPVRRFRKASETSVADAHKIGNLVLLCNRCHGRADHGDLSFESTLDPPGES